RAQHGRRHRARRDGPAHPGGAVAMWKDAWRRLCKNKMAVVCGAIAIVVAIACVFGPIVAGWLGVDATRVDPLLGAPPLGGWHWLGPATLGVDMLVRVLIGGRIALLVALTATLVALAIGVTWGAIAAYAGGRTDYVMMRIVDVLYGFPTLVFVIVVM